jgi:hypothetical protein
MKIIIALMFIASFASAQIQSVKTSHTGARASDSLRTGQSADANGWSTFEKSSYQRWFGFQVINDTVGNVPIVVAFQTSTSSTPDTTGVTRIPLKGGESFTTPIPLNVQKILVRALNGGAVPFRFWGW